MKKKDVIAKISRLPDDIVLWKEEALRFFGLITKGRRGVIGPPDVGESINFYVSTSTRRSMVKDGTVWKLFLGVNVLLLDSEIPDNVSGDKFADCVMKLVSNKVILSINREIKKKRLEK